MEKQRDISTERQIGIEKDRSTVKRVRDGNMMRWRDRDM
jgi:hypothetical protein